jgi:hypothetical protein
MFLVTPILTQGIYSGIINTISTATMGTCKLVTSIYNYENPNVTKYLKKLDIERKLDLIQSVIILIGKNTESKTANIKLNDMEKTQIFEMLGSDINLKNDPIELCLVYLDEIIQNIHGDLLAINKKVAYHNTIWFSSWRTLDVKVLLKNLKINTKLLTERFDDLTKISLFLKQN